MQVLEHDVIIAGAGPAGLMLAGELALAGIDVALVERRVDQHVEGSRASGLHPRSIELLDQRGIADRLIGQGSKHHVVLFAGAVLDASDRQTRHNYTLALWQAGIESGLADWVSGLAVRQYRGCAVTALAQGDSHVEVELDDGRTMRTRYLVGCDGGRSIVRKAAGIDFPGWEPALSYLIYEADMAGDPPFGIRHGERGIYALGRLDDGDRVRGVVTEQCLERGDRPTDDQLRDALTAAYRSDCGVHNITWLSRFTDAARRGCVLPQGPHIARRRCRARAFPVGGQGLNIGLQDAVNLGWKLAQVVGGTSPESLLDTYHAERHPVGAALLEHTLALTALNRGDDRTNALRTLMARTMQMDEPRRWYGALMSGLDIRYDLGDGHPLLGRRMPDLDIVTGEGPTRVFALLHDARPVLLNFGKPGSLAVEGCPDRIKRVDATFDGVCELPVIGAVETPAAVLIRPDGHVAWVGSGNSAGLSDACRTWFGGRDSVRAAHPRRE